MNSKQLAILIFSIVTTFLIVLSCQEDNEVTTEEATSNLVQPPEKLISFNQAKNLHENYHMNRISLIEEYEKTTRKKDDFVATRWVEWDIATIEQYIAYVKQESQKANIEIETLRFYFGQYGAEKEDKNTLLIMPTTDFNGENWGYTIQNGQPVRLNDPKSNIASKGNNGSLLLNIGNGGPPPNGCDFQ